MGWGYELWGDQLDLVFLGLFVNSIMLGISLAIIHLKILKQNQKFKQRKNRKNQKTSLEREFFKEMVERDLEKLEPDEMKKLTEKIKSFSKLMYHLVSLEKVK